MHIEVLQLLEGARQARGLTVIIDVFRAFSAACYVAANGARAIIPVGDLEQAYDLKRQHPAYILMGERGGVIQPGFDYGNSPAQVEDVDFTGRTVVHTTSAGTQGIVNARNADEIITGSFVNARAIVQYIRSRAPREVSLVCMGLGGVEPADEDTKFAEYIRNELLGKPNDFEGIVHYLAHESKTGRFLDLKDQASAPVKDFELCLSLNRFSFVLQAERGPDGYMRLNKIGV